VTRSERFRKDRLWLKTKRFAVTNSLREILEKSGLPEQERERLAYIQNKVLTMPEIAGRIFIGRTYWRDRCGSGYKRYVDMLKDWKQLDGNPSYLSTGDPTTSFPKSFWVPKSALAGGICNLDFRRKKFRPSQPDDEPTDAVSHYALKCLSELTVVGDDSYWLPDEPIRRSKIQDCCEKIASKNFDLGYGTHCRRLFHTVIMMPSDGRRNLKHPYFPLVESDVKSCHPLLLLTLMTDANERTQYQTLLAGDIYTSIGDKMGVADRDQIKVDFLRVVNTKEKSLGWLRSEYIFQFFADGFPIFTREVLSVRTDLAAYLQNLEADLMVQQLGLFCMENILFWVPQHDGWISTVEDNIRIAAYASKIIFNAIGFITKITTDYLNPIYNNKE